MFYALARAFSPAGVLACGDAADCVQLVEPSGRTLAPAKQFAVIVAGAPLARGGFVQARAGENVAQVRQWLEASNAELEGAAGCGARPPSFACEGLGTCARVTVGAATRSFNDVVIAYP